MSLAPGAAMAADLPMTPQRQLQFTTNSGTWLSLDVAPDGKSIVTDILGDLYRIPIAGGRAERLTSGMGFDSQPVTSPDGSRIAFVSDRDGEESLWIANADGSDARRVSMGADDIWSSPEWSRDGRSLFASRYLPASTAYELWHYDAAPSGKGALVVSGKDAGDPQSSLGAWPTPDGRSVIFARTSGRHRDRLPAWTIVRRDLSSGEETTLVSAPASPRTDLILGSFFRPVLSPDSRWLVYGSRFEGQSGLRLHNLASGEDRWLAFPVTHDQAEAGAWMDLLPRYDFTPDGKSLVISRNARIERLDLSSGKASAIPFSAEIDISLGPNLRSSIKQDSGPVRSRLAQQPSPSPDGSKVAYSALGRIYVMALRDGAAPVAISPVSDRAFMPSWSPDGRRITYVTWTARDDGNVWTIDATGRRKPRKVSAASGYYTYPVFTRDGRGLLAVRSSTEVRMHSYMEYGAQRRADLVAMPAQGGPARTIVSGNIGGRPHFGPERDSVYLNFADGLYRVKLDGSAKTRVLNVTGPGW
jgi:Tol biopolymer transport system component